MSLETRKVLDMLAEGKITADDAEKLLEKLQASSEADENQSDPSPASDKGRLAHRVRFLRIVVDEPGRKQVNIRMPLAFARAGMSLAGVLPASVTEKLKERGIDLNRVRLHTGKWDDVADKVFEELNLDVDKGDGKKVRIFCE
jgi:SHOCT-like protein